MPLQQRPRVQPEAEGQGAAAEQRHVAYAFHPLQALLHHLIHPAAQEDIAVAAVLSAEAEHHQQIVGAAAHLHPQPRHLGRQLAQHLAHLVLGVHLIQLRGPAAEAEVDAAAA